MKQSITQRQQEIANNIVQQLGGMKFFHSDEVEAFIPSDNGLIITLKQKATNCKVIFIDLDEGRDEYVFIAYDRRGDLIIKNDQAHCVDLQYLYEQATSI